MSSSSSSVSAFHYHELSRATFASNAAAAWMAEILCSRLRSCSGDAAARLATLRAMLRVAEEASRRFRERLRELDEHLRAAEAAGGGQELGERGKVDAEARALARVSRYTSTGPRTLILTLLHYKMWLHRRRSASTSSRTKSCPGTRALTPKFLPKTVPLSWEGWGRPRCRPKERRRRRHRWLALGALQQTRARVKSKTDEKVKNLVRCRCLHFRHIHGLCCGVFGASDGAPG